MHFTDEQIRQAFERYFSRTDAVMDVLRMAPLNKNGISTVVNAGKDFSIVNEVKQRNIGGVYIGTISDKINICRELILNANTKLPRNISLINNFAGIPLQVETEPFVFVAYDTATMNYVRKNTSLEEKLTGSERRSTKKDVKIYLVKEVDINNLFSTRITLI